MLTVGISCPAVVCRTRTTHAYVYGCPRIGIIICHCVGFLQLSVSTNLGNARASTSGMGNSESHAFLFIGVMYR